MLWFILLIVAVHLSSFWIDRQQNCTFSFKNTDINNVIAEPQQINVKLIECVHVFACMFPCPVLVSLPTVSQPGELQREYQDQITKVSSRTNQHPDVNNVGIYRTKAWSKRQTKDRAQNQLKKINMLIVEHQSVKCFQCNHSDCIILSWLRRSEHWTRRKGKQASRSSRNC